MVLCVLCVPYYKNRFCFLISGMWFLVALKFHHYFFTIQLLSIDYGWCLL